ncbi:hypothetical protein K432DRAFT_429647 [Lepidopterella palustris CBS 459.81]|uniref:Heterokaryon incompatibility domain-containing protein n=1 Tax=Lepidopterella palustris CBS 459.81 TaxID=1314670 RepID=A0A8E2E0C8_9PEZI|nr:hypothetical protein K432DRAFT_429647 [Lepidopterella palustris CBS 459.81]
MSQLAAPGAAERLIRNISGGSQRTEDLKSALDQALSALSDKLYSKTSHFLLELLQNADDNNYARDLQPTITLNYVPGTLRIDCNETGFTDDDVRAICTLGSSTKRKSSTTTGEKGIGFKSVFKVADAVRIASGDFSFRLGSNKTLGRMSPEWIPPPDDRLRRHTSMYLEIREDKREEVEKIIREFDPGTLMFLRRLEQIKIIWGNTSKTLLRKEEKGQHDTRHITILEDSRPLFCYKLITHRVDCLPRRSKDQPRTESEIVLAFPVEYDFQKAKLQDQQVYTYLPVRDFGFKFTIQADFVLVTTREDIEPSAPWNEALRDAIPDAFAKAVAIFNNTKLRYSWPIFLSERILYPFEKMPMKIKWKLEDLDILETENGQWAKPRDLVRVPDKFWFDGRPLIPSETARSKYLSVRYPEECNQTLAEFGVGKFDANRFVADLEAFITEKDKQWTVKDKQLVQMQKDFRSQDPDWMQKDFRSQSQEWHLRMAEICLKNYIVWYIRDLKVIPVGDSDGDDEWTSANLGANTLFFPPDEEDMIVPKMTGVRIVRRDALGCKETHRKNLLTQLGVEKFDESKICKIVQQAHSSNLAPSSFEKLSRADMVSHVLFLFKAGWTNPGAVDVWVATESGDLQPSSAVYFSLFEINGHKFPVLHKDYLKRIEEREKQELERWLEKQLHISQASFPRLVTSLGNDFELSQEMNLIIEYWSSAEFLELLKRHWHYYSRWLKNDAGKWETWTWRNSQEKVHDRVAQAVVECEDETRCPLNETILPSASLKEISRMADLQLLKLPESGSWSFLKHLGVKLQADMDTWLRSLRSLKSATSDKSFKAPSPETVSEIYSQIWQACGSDKDKWKSTRDIFEKQSLIYIPVEVSRKDSAIWVPPSSCIWIAPKYAYLKHVFSLSLVSSYGLNTDLFKAIEVARVLTVEMLWFDMETEMSWGKQESAELLDYVTGIFLEFNNYFKRDELTEADVDSLSEQYIFPIRREAPRNTFDFLINARSDREWFIADRRHFLDSFAGRVPLLAFTLEQIESSAPLLRRLNFNRRRLSNIAIATPVGPSKREEWYSKQLQSKARYIDYLVTDPAKDKNHSLRHMEIQLYSTEEVSIKWQVKFLGSMYNGCLEDSGSAIVNIQKNVLKIYLSKADLNPERPPLALAEELSALFDVSKSHVSLVWYILATSDPNEIEKTLEERNIPIPPNDVELLRDTKNHVHTAEPPPGGLDHTDSRNLNNNISKPDENGSVSSVVPKNAPTDASGNKGEALAIEKNPVPGPQAEISSPKLKGSTPEAETEEFLDPPTSIPLPEKASDYQIANEFSTEENGFPDPPTAAPSPKIPIIEDVKMLPSPSLHTKITSTTSTPTQEEDRKWQVLEERSEKKRSPPSYRQLRMAIQKPTGIERNSTRARHELETETPAQRLLQTSVSDLLFDSPIYVPTEFQQKSAPQPPHLVPIVSPGKSNSKQTLLEDDGPRSETQSSTLKSYEPPFLGNISIQDVEESVSNFQNHRPGNRKREIVNQFSRLVQGTRLFQVTGQTNVVYVSSPNDLPALDPREKNKDVRSVLEARMQVFQDDDRLVFAVIPTMTSAVDTEPSFLGEVWVSQLLSNHLGPALYRPAEHWQSSMRTKLGYRAPLPTPKDDDLPFKISDKKGALTHFLVRHVRHSYTPAKEWQRKFLTYGDYPTYHIDVHTTGEEKLERPFLISSARFDKARQYWRSSEDVLILVRIFNIHEKPTAVFYVDPWEVYSKGGMDVKVCSDMYEIALSKSASHFDLDNPERRIYPGRRHTGIFGPLRNWFHSARKPRIPEPESIPAAVREYKWQPLEKSRDIRLLELRPGDDVSELRGSLKSVSLDSIPKPEYQAISYAWGSKLKQFSLHIDDETMMLTASLYLGLRRLRQTDRTILIWADAICIDQDGNNPEKAQQIRMLPDIFRTAKVVFAWIGEDEYGSEGAMAKFKNWGEIILDYKSRANSKSYVSGWSAMNINLPAVDDSVWTAISKLVSRKWFSRIWIVQEVVLASDLKVVCGGLTISWDVFYAAVFFCFQQEELKKEKDLVIADDKTRNNIVKLGQLRHDGRQKTGQFQAEDDMFTILRLCHLKEVTEPRDRMFGLLSIATDAGNEELWPDYDSDQSTIVKKYARVFVEQGRALDVLYHARLFRTPESLQDLPSWVPDFSASPYPDTLSTWSKGHFDATRLPDGNHQTTPDRMAEVFGESLLIEGYRIGTISHVGKTDSTAADLKTYLKEIFDTVEKVYEGASSQKIDNIKCRLPIGDARDPTSGKTTGVWYNYEADATDAYHALMEFLSQDQPETVWKSQRAKIEASARSSGGLHKDHFLFKRLWPYINTAMDFAGVFWPNSAVVCATTGDNGQQVGIVPTSARKEDVVVLFRGAKVPFLIRGVGARKEAYHVVGECYIDGIMHGEALQDGGGFERIRLV